MCNLHSLPHRVLECFPLFYHIERELVLVFGKRNERNVAGGNKEAVAKVLLIA